MRKIDLLKNLILQATGKMKEMLSGFNNKDLFIISYRNDFVRIFSAIANGRNPSSYLYRWMGAYTGINSPTLCTMLSFSACVRDHEHCDQTYGELFFDELIDTNIVLWDKVIEDCLYVLYNNDLELEHSVCQDCDPTIQPIGSVEPYYYDEDRNYGFDNDYGDDDGDDGDSDDIRDPTIDIGKRLEYGSKLKLIIPKLESEGKKSSEYAKDKRFFFGIELEIEWPDEGHSGRIESLYDNFNINCTDIDCQYDGDNHINIATNNFICKYDSSIGSEEREGTEIVFQPRCLEESKEYFSPILDYLLDQGALSFDTNGRCGIHMHIGKERVGDDMAKSVVDFMIDNKRFCELWAQRKSGHYNDFSRLEAGYLPPEEHCAAIANIKDNTYELRIFKGTLNKETFISYIQFATTMFELAEGNLLNLDNMIKRLSDYPESKARLNKIINKLKNNQEESICA